jgi:hypothetical protein
MKIGKGRLADAIADATLAGMHLIKSRGRLRPQPASDGCDPSRRRGHHGQHLPAGGAEMMIMPYFRDPPGHRARNLCSGEVASKHFKV